MGFSFGEQNSWLLRPEYTLNVFVLIGGNFVLNLRCAKCDVQFESAREKNQHARTKHGSTEKQAECPICQKTYNKSYLKDHMITHSQSETLKCQECEKTFSSKSNLNKHRKKHVPGYTPNSSKQREKKFTCPEEGCEKTFDSRHALKVCLSLRCQRNFWGIIHAQ